jgi:hypothetical protein
MKTTVNSNYFSFVLKLWYETWPTKTVDNYLSRFKAFHARFQRQVKIALNYILGPQFTTHASLKLKMKKYNNDKRMPSITLGIGLFVIYSEFWLYLSGNLYKYYKNIIVNKFIFIYIFLVFFRILAL